MSALLGHCGVLLGALPFYDYSLSRAPGNLICALSLQKVFDDSSVSVRVRRSTDNAEIDIGFNGADLDVSTLMDFVGAGSAYVTTIYDQSGNAKHATQPVAAGQPKIVDAGAYSGRILFNGTTNWLRITSLAIGTPFLGLYERIRQPAVASSKIILEASENYNSASQAFLHFAGVFGGSESGLSANACNTAGQQRANQWVFEQSDLETLAVLWNRNLVGSSEISLSRSGASISPSYSPQTIEQTGVFGTHNIYIGARGGSTLYSDMHFHTMLLTSYDTRNLRPAIENSINRQSQEWRSRLNAPVSLTKIGGRYFLVDCWHHRVLYTDDLRRPIWSWNTLDEMRLVGPHSIAYDGTLYVVDNTELARVEWYTETAGVFSHAGSINVGGFGSRPHCVLYDAGTAAFYALNSMTQQIVKLTRSGLTLSIAHTNSLSFLGGVYTRHFRIIDGKMVFVTSTGSIYVVSFTGSSGGYTVESSYALPVGFTDCNDVFRAADGTWYATSGDGLGSGRMISFSSLPAMASGTYEDKYAAWQLSGNPYWFSEFDAALWLPTIINNNGVIKRQNEASSVLSRFGPENPSSYDRHHNYP